MLFRKSLHVRSQIALEVTQALDHPEVASIQPNFVFDHYV